MPTHEYEAWVRPEFLPPMEWDPQEEWGRITGRQAPYWQARQPMRQLGQRLQARYMLGAPGADYTNFGDFVSGWVGGEAGDWGTNTYQDLLTQAQAAAAATRLASGQYMAGFETDTDPWKEAAWYTGAFNPTGGLGVAQAQANQLAVATMLAQQRQGTGGGAYGGRLGMAIAAAMENLQQYRQDIGNPPGSFLDWYLSRGATPADIVADQGGGGMAPEETLG